MTDSVKWRNPILDSQTLLYRQISEPWVRENRVTSQAFKPTGKDKGYLSTYDGDQISAEDAWHHFNERYRSIGVMALSVQECAQVCLDVRADPQPDFPEHVIIDFTDHSRNQQKKAAGHLARNANERGWQYLARA